jgi:hypothetical protein
MPTKPEFRFRLNGNYMPEIRIQREAPDGEIQLAVRDEDLGWFVIDNNENLRSDALPKFVLEYRDETAWALVPVDMRQASEDKGWNRTTPRDLVGVLWVAGVIEWVAASNGGSDGGPQNESVGWSTSP